METSCTADTHTHTHRAPNIHNSFFFPFQYKKLIYFCILPHYCGASRPSVSDCKFEDVQKKKSVLWKRSWMSTLNVLQ